MRLTRALLGPALIAGAVFVSLHDYALGTSVAPGNADVRAFFLPNHCYLGQSLSAGIVPGWNPFQMGGIPFAADPQSGWMYAPAMLLYWAVPCDRAMPLFLFLQPLLAGMGLYAFLRTETLSRIAATCGGLVLALTIAGTSLTIAVSFSGALAWTAIALAAVARYFKSPSVAGRCGWAVLAAFAWGQIAAAHLSHGFLLGSAAIGTYILVIVVRSDVPRAVIGWAALLVGALVAVNLAFFLPRLAYLPQTSLALGYDELRDLGAVVPGDDLGDLPGLTWPLSFVTSPGIYAGALVLVLSLGALLVRGGRRDLALGFAAFGVGCFVLGSASFALATGSVAKILPLGDFYIRAPMRFAYGLPLAFAITSAVGVDAWRASRTARDRMLLVAPGLLLWTVLPPLAGARVASLALFAVGCAAGAVVLSATALRPATAIAIPVVLAAELAANSLIGQRATEPKLDGIVSTSQTVWSYHQLLAPGMDLRGWSRDPVLEDLALRNGRLMTLDPFIWSLSRPMLFSIEELHGYNPVQLRRYWQLVHRHNVERIRYYTGAFLNPSPALYELFNVSVATGDPDRVAEAARMTDSIVERQGVPLLPIDGGDRAVFRTRWEVAASEDDSLQRVAAPGFSFEDPVVLEAEPGIAPSPTPQPAVRSRYRWEDTQSATVTLNAPSDGLVVIKNSHDRHWTATVNGRRAPVLVADHVIQAVPIVQGENLIELRYADPWIGRGITGSIVSLMALLGAGIILRRMPPASTRRREDS